MTDIFDKIFEAMDVAKNNIDNEYRRFRGDVFEKAQSRGKEDVIIEKLNSLYQKRYNIEDKYSYLTTERLKKIKNLNTLSRQEIVLLGEKIQKDVKEARTASLEGREFGPSEPTPIPRVDLTGLSSLQIADKLILEMGLSGKNLEDALIHASGASFDLSKGLGFIVSKLEEVAEGLKGVRQESMSARENFEQFAGEKLFGKLDGVISNKFTQLLGLKKPLLNLKNKVTSSLGGVYQGIFENVLSTKSVSTMGQLAGGMGNFARFAGLAKFALVGTIGVIIAIGYALYKAFDVWKRFKQTSIDIQKDFGVTRDRAKALTNEVQNLYFQNAFLGLSWEQSAETVRALYKNFLDVKDVTSSLAQLAVNYQKAYGLSADEAAEVLKTNKLIFGLSDDALKAQDEHIVKFSAQTGFSAKQMKLLYADASLVAKLGYENIDKLAATAQKANLSFQEMQGLIDGIFEIGDFEGSINKAAKLIQLGIQVDPLDIQFKLNEGDYDSVIQDLLGAFDVAGKNLSTVSGLERKLIADAVGGEAQLQKLAQAQNELKKKSLSVEEKASDLRATSFEDLLAQTTQTDKLAGIWDSLMATFEAIITQFTPAIEAMFAGFQEGFKPLLESFAMAKESGEGIFSEKQLAQLSEYGKQAGELLSGMITGFQYLGKIIGYLVNPFMVMFQTMKGIFNLAMGLINGVLAGIADSLKYASPVIDLLFGTNITEKLDKFSKNREESAFSNFKSFQGATEAAGESAFRTFADPISDLGDAFTDDSTVSTNDIIVNNENNNEKVVSEQQKTNDLLGKLIGVMSQSGGSPDTNKVLMALSKAAKT